MSELDPRTRTDDETGPLFDTDRSTRADAEVTDADAAEERRSPDDDLRTGHRGPVPDDVDPADAADQYREIGDDEDDYR